MQNLLQILLLMTALTVSLACHAIPDNDKERPSVLSPRSFSVPLDPEAAKAARDKAFETIRALTTQIKTNTSLLPKERGALINEARTTYAKTLLLSRIMAGDGGEEGQI